MSQERPLQELPCLSENFEGSMLSHSKKSITRKKKTCFGEGLDTENTPNDLIQIWSPPHKQLRVLPKGKENQECQFVLARRSRRKESTGLSWDSLPDELLLRLFLCLSLQDLLRASRVCKRWHRLTCDDSLWHSVDLMGMTDLAPALEQVFLTGVRRLRCPRSLIGETHFIDACPLRLQQLDLSNCTISTTSVENILSRCTHLLHLSLEGLDLSDKIIQFITQNRELQQLNLSGCSGFSAESLGDMLKALTLLTALNISWCGFNNDHVKAVVSNVCPGISQLNLSGYRMNLVQEDLKILVESCPNIVILDLSDSVMLTIDSFPILGQLKVLLQLCLSRCYQIHPAALGDLEMLPALRQLEVYGLVQDSHLRSLKKGMPQISINSMPFSNVARPTPASQNDRTMWDLPCRLRYKS